MTAIIGVERCYLCGLKITEDGYERRTYNDMDDEFICADCLRSAEDAEYDATHQHPWPRTNATVGHFYKGDSF